MTGTGNSSVPVEYEYFDVDPQIGTLYYRLKQTDFNGKYTYSEIRQVHFNGQEEVTLQTWPNPVQNHLNISLENAIGENFEVKIINVQGASVSQIVPVKHLEEGRHQIDVSNLPPGLYQIILDSDDKQMVRQWVKN